MRYYLCFLFSVMLLGCSDVEDCFESPGVDASKSFEVADFSKITVFENLNLRIVQGDAYAVSAIGGENLLDNISVQVDGDRLLLRNNQGCTITNKTNQVTIQVTAPNLSEIRLGSGGTVTNEGVLEYTSLNLIAEDSTNPDTPVNDGTFYMRVNTGTLRLVTNGFAYFSLEGVTNNFVAIIASGDSRVEADQLQSSVVDLLHRGTNDILLDVTDRITGTISGYGDVICATRPTEVDVNEIFRGKLIFQDE